MTVKYRIGLTITAETLFGMLSKFLPVDNLDIEEIVEPPPPRPAAQLVKPHKPHKPHKLHKGRAMRYGYESRLDVGANAVVLKLLNDGQPHQPQELRLLMQAAGYSPNGCGAKLARLRENGYIFQPQPGLWQLTRPPQVNSGE